MLLRELQNLLAGLDDAPADHDAYAFYRLGRHSKLRHAAQWR